MRNIIMSSDVLYLMYIKERVKNWKTKLNGVHLTLVNKLLENQIAFRIDLMLQKIFQQVSHLMEHCIWLCI